MNDIEYEGTEHSDVSLEILIQDTNQFPLLPSFLSRHSLNPMHEMCDLNLDFLGRGIHERVEQFLESCFLVGF